MPVDIILRLYTWPEPRFYPPGVYELETGESRSDFILPSGFGL